MSLSATGKTESAWLQGVLAFRRGVGLSGCPSSSDPRNIEAALDAQGWQNGWRWARRCWCEQRDNPSTPGDSSAST